MRQTAIFFGFLFCCLLAGTLIAVPLMQTGWLHAPPARVVDRLAQALILIGIWPLLGAMGLKDKASLGYGVPRRGFLRALGLGWLVGVAILLALALGLLGLGVRVHDPHPGTWTSLLVTGFGASLGGLAIGLLEETFFRGALFAGIRRSGGLVPAVVWSAALYAVLHVMKPGALPPGIAFDWSGAWTMLVGVFGDAFRWRRLDTVLALFTVGVFLALVRERTGHIGWCVGLHAGWVPVIALARRLTDDNPTSPLAFLIGDYDGLVGWLAMAWIGVLAAAYWRYWPRPSLAGPPT